MARVCKNCGAPIIQRPGEPDGWQFRRRLCCSTACAIAIANKTRWPLRDAESVIFLGAEIDHATGCWEWAHTRSRYGYGIVRFSGKQHVTSRLSYETFVGEIPPGLMVLHACDNPPCCNPGHLFVGTHQDNMDDMALKGRARAGNRKLSLAQCAEIRTSTASGPIMASRFGVSTQTISNVRRGLIYRDAPLLEGH
jgi:hypothetical protein